MKRNWLVEFFWRIHPRIYLWSSGRIGAKLRGLPILLLTTKGRKTGNQRTKALMYLPQGQDFVVFASNLGASYHPAWWLNLEANPDAVVEVQGERYPIVAREAVGQEREVLWLRVTELVPEYETYKRRTTRKIPVVVLERKI